MTDWTAHIERLNKEAASSVWDMECPRPVRTRPLLVIGTSEDVRALQPYLGPTGFRAASIATSIDALAERLPHHPGTPILVAESADNTRFAPMARAVAALVGTDRQILHPAFLAAHAPFDLSNTVVTYGHAGAGNVIVQRIIRDLVTASPRGLDPLASWCAGAHLLLCDAIKAACEDLGANAVHIGYGDIGSVNCLVQFKDIGSGLMIPHVPSLIYMADRVYGTHAIPRPDSIDRILDCGGKVVFVLRHPLDILVAIAGKQSLLEDRNAGAPPTDRTARQERIRRAVDNPVVFDSALLDQRGFLVRAGRFKDLAVLARYEDLMEDPRREISRLARCLGAVPSDDAVDALAGLVGTTELGPAGHMIQPGVGKWRTTLPPHRLAQAHALGLMTAAAPFGYTADPAEVEAPPLSDYVSPYTAVYCLSDPELRSAVRRAFPFTGIGGIDVFGYCEHAVARWRRRVESDSYFHQILHCMALRPDASHGTAGA